MIRFEARRDEYSYRVADALLDSSVAEVEEGQWVTFNAAGNLVVADGTKKAFLAIGSKRSGRNQIGGVPVKKITFLHGPWNLKISNFDPAGDYGEMEPLKVTAGGILTPWVSADSADKIVGYAKGIPVDGYLNVFSA